MANKWRRVLISFVKEELERLDAYCKENHVKRTDVIRSATRLYIANRDLVNGVIRLRDASLDIAPMMEDIKNLRDVVVQKIEDVKEKLSSISVEDNYPNLAIKERIAEAVLMIKRRGKKNTITVEQLKEKLKTIDPSFTPFLYATASSSICVLDKVLLELEGKGELSRLYGGIIKWR
ncbi:MAG: hypothetical protein QXX08_09190 [Candidatus Bathyarchaeia archaeon]